MFRSTKNSLLSYFRGLLGVSLRKQMVRENELPTARLLERNNSGGHTGGQFLTHGLGNNF